MIAATLLAALGPVALSAAPDATKPTDLFVLLQSPERSDRVSAAERLASVRPVEQDRVSARETLVESLRQTPLHDHVLISGLIRALDRWNIDAVTLLTGAVEQADEMLSLPLSLGLRDARPAVRDRAAAALIPLIGSERPAEIRLRAIESVGLLRLNHHQVLDRVRAAFDEMNPRLRLRVITALKRTGDASEGTVAVYARALEDPSPPIAQQAIDSLAALGTKARSARTALEKVRDRSEGERRRALELVLQRLTTKQPVSTAKLDQAAEPAAGVHGKPENDGVKRSASSLITLKRQARSNVSRAGASAEGAAPSSTADIAANPVGAPARAKGSPRDTAAVSGNDAARSAADPESPRLPPIAITQPRPATAAPVQPAVTSASAAPPPRTLHAALEAARPAKRADARGALALPQEQPAPAPLIVAGKKELGDHKVKPADAGSASKATSTDKAGAAHSEPRGRAVQASPSELPPAEAVPSIGAISAADPDAEARLIAALSDSRSEVRAEAGMKAAELSINSDAMRAALAKTLRDREAKVRFAAAYALSTYGPASVDALREAIADPSPAVRLNAIQALKNVRPLPPEASRILEERLKEDTDPSVQIQAALAIVKANPRNEPAVETLVSSLGTPNAELNRLATEALRQTDPDLISRSFTLALAQQNAVGRQRLIAALTRLVRSEAQALPVLAPLLEDKDDKVRAAAEKALGDLASR